MPRPITVLVTGATGKQGAAAASALNERGHRVRALTRKPRSPSARALAQRGVEVVRGDLDEPASLAAACAGCDAVFAMSTPFEQGPAAEARQGRAICDAARDAGVGHVVYTSVAGASKPTGIPHFDSKHEVERHLAALGVPYTVVAPVFFMENHLSPRSLPALREGALALPLPARRRLQQIAVADIGQFCRIVLERRSELEGKRIEIASDEVTGVEAARILSAACGRELVYRAVPLEEVHRASEDLARMFEYLGEVGFQADVAGLRRDFPDVGWHDLGSWAREQDWSVLDQPAAAGAAAPPRK